MSRISIKVGRPSTNIDATVILTNPLLYTKPLVYIITTIQILSHVSSVTASPTHEYVHKQPGMQAIEIDFKSQCPESCTCFHANSKSPKLHVDSSMELHVDCSQRGLYDFPTAIPTSTRWLDMSGNKLVNVTSLPSLPELKELDLSNNWLRHIDNKWVFEHSPRLKILRLSENRLRTIRHGSFNGLSHLEELDLSRNIITSLDTHALAGLTSLKILRLDQNQLYDLSREWFISLNSLIELYAQHNHISVLESHVLDRHIRLQHLDLSQNALRLVHKDAMAGLINLKFFNLSANTQLSPFSPNNVFDNTVLPTLDILLVDDTGLKRFSPFAATNLSVTELSISYQTLLRAVDKHAITHCNRLHTLQLHDNPQLVYLHPEAFLNLPNLKRLLIHNNGLIAVPGQIITSLPSLADLAVHHNPLHCDCNSYWLRKELHDISSLLKKPHHLTKQIFTPRPNLNQVTSNTNQHDHTSTSTTSSSILSPSSSSSSSSPTSIISSSNPMTNSTTKPKRCIIREPDRVACFFPSSPHHPQSSQPMVQMAMQYFHPTCQPSTIPLFPTTKNITLGGRLVLECHGLGVPEPNISWRLPNGSEINISSSNSNQRIKATEDTFTITNVKLSDSGIYSCSASNEFGTDLSSVSVYVHNKPLDMTEVKVGYDYITLGLRGNIARSELNDFQVYYKPYISGNPVDNKEGEIMRTNSNIDVNSEGYKVIRFKSYTGYHLFSLRHLNPNTLYNVCLVYKDTHPVSCKQWKTINVLRAVQQVRGIVSVSKQHVIMAIVGGLGTVIVLAVIVMVIKRRSKSRGYDESSQTKVEKSTIPMDGLLSKASSNSLTSSRTALLSNSHV